MKNSFRPTLYGALALLIFSVTACNKKPEQIGLGLIPDVNQVNVFYTDTIQVTAYSILEDSIRTDEPSNILLGSIKDPVFGTSVAGFFTQFALSTNGHDFGANPLLDSLVLQLAYSGYYGDTSAAQTIRAYEIEEQLFADSNYYSKRQIPYDQTDHAGYQLNMRPKSSFIFLEDTLNPMFRIRLSDISTSIGDKLLGASVENLESTEKFQEFFKGLFITADPVSSGGAMAYLNLPSNLSRMTIYYRNDEQDSLRYEFFMTSTTARFNRFEHNDYLDASPEFRQQVIEGDTSLGNQKIYIQAMGGVKTFIRFPHLAKFANTLGKKVIINEAKLIFTGIDTLTDYTSPAQLALVSGTDEKGKYTIVPDQFEGDSYFGGTYKKSVNAYEFRITKLVQQMILDGNDKIDYGLYAFVSGASGMADRKVFHGVLPGSDTLNAFQLKVIYTRVE